MLLEERFSEIFLSFDSERRAGSLSPSSHPQLRVSFVGIDIPSTTALRTARGRQRVADRKKLINSILPSQFLIRAFAGDWLGSFHLEGHRHLGAVVWAAALRRAEAWRVTEGFLMRFVKLTDFHFSEHIFFSWFELTSPMIIGFQEEDVPGGVVALYMGVVKDRGPIK